MRGVWRGGTGGQEIRSKAIMEVVWPDEEPVIICANGTGQKTKDGKSSLYFSPHGWLFDSSIE